MKDITWRHIVVFVLVAIIAFALDRFTKEYLIHTLDNPLEIIPNFFTLRVQENSGVAFSIGLPHVVQIVLTPILLFVGMKLAIDYLQMNNKFVLIILGAIVGGAMSNFADRILYQSVIDYLSFWHYPVFNLADTFIVVGIFIIVAFYGKMKRV